MVELNDHVLDEFGHRGDSLIVEEFLSLIERYHPTDGPGVDRSVVEAYAEALDERGMSQLRSDDIEAALDRKTVESETWGGDGVYEIGGGRLSNYPAAWHDNLGGSTNIVEFVEALTDVDPPIGQTGAGGGVPEDTLIDIAAVVGGLDREEAKSRLEELRRDGPIVEDADQHPQAGVRLEE
jgi:hypothetical protein